MTVRGSLDPAKMSKKWGNNLKNAVGDMVDGINAVTENPMHKAAAKADKMKANIVKAIDSGRWAAGLKKVDLVSWQRNAVDKINQRLAGGVDAAMPKREEFDKALAQHINANLSKIDAMPDLTAQDNKNRMTAWFDVMSSWKYKK